MKHTNIPLFVPTYRVEECLEAIRECLEKGWTGLGYKTIQFEEKWKEYTGLPHAHYLQSATAGLSLAIQVLKMTKKWKVKDEIITTPLTFVSTNHAIRYHGLSPVFADIDEQLCLDPEAVERRITPRTRAVMFVGLGGNTGQYERIAEICERHKLALIIDAAHMAGTRLHGVIPGREADAVIYSFQAVKNLPTADSGMVCFKEEAHDKLARKLSWLGINKDTYTRSTDDGQYKWLYDVEHVGFKYHGNSIMAAIAITQLKYLDEDNAFRNQLRRWYEQELYGLEEHIRIVPIATGCDSSNHLFMIEVNDKRNELIDFLNQAGIYPGVHYRINTDYRMYRHAQLQCPRAEHASRHILSLPMHLRMTEEDINRVASRIRTFWKQ